MLKRNINKFSIRIVSLLLVCVFCFSLLIGCDNRKNANVVFPDYQEQSFRFGVFSSPAPTQEAYNECAEAGFNCVLIDQNYGSMSSPIYREIMQYCYNAGMDSVLMNLVAADFETDSERDADLCSRNGYIGKNFIDEPTYDQIDTIASYIEDFERDNPDKLFLNNLLPYYSSDTSVYGDSYEGYVEKYVNTVLKKLSGQKILMCDIYPYTSTSRGDSLIPGYLYNLETLAHYVEGTDIKTEYYFLTHGLTYCRDMSSERDISFQLNTYLAYGVTGFWAFTYPDQKAFSDKHALVKNENKNGTWVTTKNDVYYYTQEAIRKVKTMEDAYMYFDYVGTKTFVGSLNENGYNDNFDMLNYELKELKGITDVKATQDTIIGLFEKDGLNAYLISNFTEPSYGLADKVEIELKEGSKAQVFYDGEVKEMNILNDKLVLVLNSGAAAFVVVA